MDGSREQSERMEALDGRRIKARRFVVAGILGAIAMLAMAFFLIRTESEKAVGNAVGTVSFTFAENEGAVSLARHLEEAGLIRTRIAFLYRLWVDGSWKKLQAGEYALNGGMTIPELIGKFSRGETIEKGVKITFPEGWTAAEMAERLSKNGLPGEDFLALSRKPKPEWRAEHPFLANIPDGGTLEGVLFPDTYFFDPNGDAEQIILKMLAGFQSKAEPALSGRSGDWYGTLVLASILETEVRTEDDRRAVADLFLRRIGAGMPLQSDATVRYVLGVTKVQHSLDDIAIDSPYNTYKHLGLPPGPIANPGLVSIRAAISPSPNPYWYFLNNPKTGVTVFSATFEEHVANKSKNGL